jgi:hypothetical protein
MPVHDWTRVSAGTFHDFHNSWMVELKRVMNRGLLPAGFYAQTEQIAGEIGPDVLTLRTRTGDAPATSAKPSGATAVTERPPQVSITAVADEAELFAEKRKVLVIYHTSGDEIIALVEIVSAGNKNHARALERFLNKAYSILVSGYHLLLIDLHPRGVHDPHGIHGAVWADFDSTPYQPPPNKPLTVASYCAGTIKRAYVEPIAVGDALPDMPLFLDDGWYVDLPLEETYQTAYESL